MFSKAPSHSLNAKPELFSPRFSEAFSCFSNSARQSSEVAVQTPRSYVKINAKNFAILRDKFIRWGCLISFKVAEVNGSHTKAFSGLLLTHAKRLANLTGGISKLKHFRLTSFLVLGGSSSF